jgi:predicted GNAT family acetyltransferase
MTFVLTRDAEKFAGEVGPLIERRLECNVLATVLGGVRQQHQPNSNALFGYRLAPGGRATAAVMRLAPWPLLVGVLDPDDAGELVRAWTQEDPRPPGVSGQARPARAVAKAWAELTGGSSRVRMREAMHVLEQVHDPARPAPGALREADESDFELLVAWMVAFAREAGVAGGERSRQMVRSRMNGRGLFVWDHGRPVSMLAAHPSVGGVVRIGPVYTPPEHRRRGYAGAAVAALSRRALAAGAARCMLFTDLANLTSNKIYAEVGYRRAGAWEEHDLLP